MYKISGSSHWINCYTSKKLAAFLGDHGACGELVRNQTRYSGDLQRIQIFLVFTSAQYCSPQRVLEIMGYGESDMIAGPSASAGHADTRRSPTYPICIRRPSAEDVTILHSTVSFRSRRGGLARSRHSHGASAAM
ncbi:unnamed protein product [Peniophora sp. CBMAI 1063]|nr:unnamed protein product [Peniophora sp. CBMAI 1063]